MDPSLPSRSPLLGRHRSLFPSLSVGLNALALRSSALPMSMTLRRPLKHLRKLRQKSSDRWSGCKIGSITSTLPYTSGTGRRSPPAAAGARRTGVVWFRADLRLHDNEALHRANSECSSLLPLYCFDPRDYGRSPQGYDRTGPYRASFLIQAVADLRERLRSVGSELIVRIGRPEDVLADVARRVGAAAVYCHSEVTYEESKQEARVKKAMEGLGVKMESFWTNTLHHPDNLPFKLAEMPQNFDRFKRLVSSVEARRPLPAPETLKGFPLGSRRIIASGEIPTLKDLGLQPLQTSDRDLSMSAIEGYDDDKRSACDASTKSTYHSGQNSSKHLGSGAIPNVLSSCPGGESHALRQLKRFIESALASASPRQGPNHSHSSQGRHGYGRATSFSSSVAPYLATGCLSPRAMLQEAEKKLRERRNEDAKENAYHKGTQSALQWVQFELLWRDFFRLLTRRHSEVVLPRFADARIPTQA